MSSISLAPEPSKAADPNFGNLLIIDDVLYPKDNHPHVGRDAHIRIALFIISQALPVISTVLLVLSQKGWWRIKSSWTMNRLAVLWLITIQIFAVVAFVQDGATDRVTFICAALHLQLEYMMIALLLKSSALTALVVAYIAGTILYTAQLFLKDLSVVYILSVSSGFTDFFIPLLFFYGKQWFFATAGFAHLIQAATLFAAVVKNFGHIENSFLTFITTWIMNGALVAAVFKLRRSTSLRGRIRLSSDNSSTADEDLKPEDTDSEAADNPLATVEVPHKILALLFGISIAGSVGVALSFTFIVASN